MELPISFRPGKNGSRLNRFARRTGLKRPDIIELAIRELFKAHPTDKDLAAAVIKFRAEEAAK